MTEEIRLKIQRAALAVRENAYVPYSHFMVGAALLSKDGRIFTGCNFENSSYGATICAERSAFAKAVSEGAREFEAIAICGGPEGGELREECYPCGMCRQVMSEFCGPDFKVILFRSDDIYSIRNLSEMLPFAFGL